MTVRGLGQEPAATTISSKGYAILTHVTCSVHFWTYICHQNSFHSNSFSSRVMRMSWVSQYFPCYTMLCCHTFTFVLRILLWVHFSIAYIYGSICTSIAYICACIFCAHHAPSRGPTPCVRNDPRLSFPPLCPLLPSSTSSWLSFQCIICECLSGGMDSRHTLRASTAHICTLDADGFAF